MTPLQLLEEVQGRFIVLYHNEEPALHRLLAQALTKFQEKAGVLFTVRVNGPEVDLPEFFWKVASCHDNAHRFVPTQPDREDGKLRLGVIAGNTPPYTIHYFIKLRDWPEDRDLPTSCISLVADYLEALIAIPNTDRERRTLSATGLPFDHLPAVQELRARLADIEVEMEDAKAILPPIAVY